MKLEPGMYVKTEGLSDADYHAVAEAFIGAGAARGEYGVLTPSWYKYMGWREYEGVFFSDSGKTSENFNPVGFGPNAREVTVDEVLGRNQTPCQKLGYRVGDRFEVVMESTSSAKKGEVVVLEIDDRSNAPYFKNERTGKTACCCLDRLRPLSATTEWPGTGLPPVGTHCEYTKVGSAVQVWWECDVIAMDGGEPVIKTELGHYHRRPVGEYKFRPLKSGREREIKAIIDLLQGTQVGESIAAKLYDAGYRKMEGES